MGHFVISEAQRDREDQNKWPEEKRDFKGKMQGQEGVRDGGLSR